jgi:hypothetical protein
MKSPRIRGRADQGYDSRKKDLFASDFVARTRNTKASIPAPFASSDTKISLFAVQSSFARAIFSSRHNKNRREYWICISGGFL